MAVARVYGHHTPRPSKLLLGVLLLRLLLRLLCSWMDGQGREGQSAEQAVCVAVEVSDPAAADAATARATSTTCGCPRHSGRHATSCWRVRAKVGLVLGGAPEGNTHTHSSSSSGGLQTKDQRRPVREARLPEALCVSAEQAGMLTYEAVCGCRPLEQHT